MQSVTLCNDAVSLSVCPSRLASITEWKVAETLYLVELFSLMRVTGPFQADRLNFTQDHRVQLKIQISVKQVDA